ncbi:MAG: MBL fold metallo-hydrolase [Gammaproteobacteria bacterium]|jgi:flavorubredoxin|nr:MBL fold metallo-hydrolase [Gammaproteobacteria bacterium]
MSEKYLELFNNGEHRCISFHDLVSGDGIQSNQFLVIDNERAALIDPGGDLTFTALKIAISSIVRLGELDYVIASHQDPDIIASIGRWLMHSNSRIVASHLWSRFLPHLVSDFVNNQVKYGLGERIIALPDEGGRIPLGNTALIAVPAHFLHSVGNLQFYDPVSRILFSGDMGASIGGGHRPVTDFDAHVPLMEGFHKRYMCSNKVCRLWADMVRSMDVDMIVPQHGAPFKGKETIGRFLDWISRLECGIDLLSQRNYRVAG